MDTNSLCALLSETERCNAERFDAICLDCATWIDNIIKLLHCGINIVCIAISRNYTSVEGLQTSIEHPSTSGTLGMTSQILLEDAKYRIAFLAAKVLQLLADDIGF